MGKCKRTVDCNSTSVIGQVKQQITPPNPPITEFITVTVATTTYPKNSVYTEDIFSSKCIRICFVFFFNFNGYG